MTVSLGGFMAGWRMLVECRGKLALAFLLLGLPAGLGLALFTPMGNVPDEPAHLARAEGLLYGEILGHRGDVPLPAGRPGAGVDVDPSAITVAISELFPTLHGTPLPPQVREQARAVKWGDSTIYFPTQMVQYFPALYMPAAAGLGVGRALGLSPLRAAFLARIFMLVSYLAMGAAALRLARFGQPVLFTLLLLPVSLMLAASFSQDGQLIAATALAAALLTRAGPKPGLAWAVALGLLVLVTCSKPPYAPLLGLCLLPLARPGFWARLCLAAAGLALPLAWMGLMTRCCYTDWSTAPYHPGPLWPGASGLTLTAVSASMNLKVLLAHPAQIFILPLTLIPQRGPALWGLAFAWLGWRGLHLPDWQSWGWSLAFGAALLACMAQPGPRPRAREAVFAALLLAAAYFAVTLSLYLSFTRVGWTEIVGVSGRYLLPFWPVLPFVLRHWCVPRRLEVLGMVPALVMAAADIWALPALSLHTYHMAGP